MKNNTKFLNILIFTILVGLFTTCEGPMGPQGEQGLQGEQGAKGDKGDTGQEGEQGQKGDKGDTGQQGEQGLEGEQGQKGDKGDKGEQFIIERVSFTSLTANGDANTTTTRLTLSFSADITGLSSADITIIDHGNTGAVVGPLTRTGEGTYNLIVLGINAPGTISVVVSNNRYIFNPVYRSVAVHYNASMSPSFTNIEDMAAWLLSVQSNSSANPYQIRLSGLNLETDLMFNTDPLRKLFDALNRYAVIDLRDCTGEFISNIVSEALVNARPNKERLVSILLPDSLTAIGDYAFYSTHLTSISLPASLTTIGDYAFSKCYYLTSINLPASLSAIGDYVFHNSSGLTSINLPASLTAIGIHAFYHINIFSVYGSGPLSASADGIMLILNTTVIAASSESVNVTVPAGITAIGDRAFSARRMLTSINLPATLTNIGSEAFHGCIQLTSINLPASLITIGDNAFGGCSALTSIDLPASLTNIGSFAFSACELLTSINLPASLTTIGSYAFYMCASLSSIICNAILPPVPVGAINYAIPPSTTIKVPAGSVAAYKAASGWSNYADRISAIE